MKQLINKRLPVGSFARNVVTLMSGTTFAQALLILVAPILTRLYSPEDFGVFALYTSILGIISVVACWRYELAIVLPEKDEDAANILVLSICTCFGMAIVTLALLALFRNLIANLLSAPELAPWLWFMPLSLITAGLFAAFNYWSTRREQFKRLAVRQITQSTVTSVTQLFSGFMFHPGAGGLISGSILGQFTATFCLARQIWINEGKQLIATVSFKKMYQMFIRYKIFPIYDTWSSLLNTASSMLPAILLGVFFTPTIVGYYALGHRVLAIPVNIIGGSVAQAFFPRATEAFRKGNLKQVTFELFQQLLSIGLVPILLIAIVAPDLFALVFGSRWWMAGEYVRWLSLWLFFVFVSSPLATIYLILNRQRYLFVFNLLMFITRLSVIVMGGLYGDPLLTIALFGITGVIFYIFNCLYIQYLAGVPIREILSAIGKQLLCSIPYLVLPLGIWIGTGNRLAFVQAGMIAGVIFLIISFIKE